MKLTKLFKKARLGKRRKGEVSDVDTEALVSRQRPVATSAPPALPASPTPRSPHSAAAPARRHSIQRQTVAAQQARPSAASRVVPLQPSTHLPRSRSAAPQKTPAPNPPAKPHPKKPAVFHDIMPPRGVQRSRNSSFTKPSVKPQPPKHALSPSRASLIKPTASAPAPAKRPLNKLSSVKAQPVKPLSSHPPHPPLTKPPLSSQPSSPTRPLNPAAAASARRPAQSSVTSSQTMARSSTDHPKTSPRATPAAPAKTTPQPPKHALSPPHSQLNKSTATLRTDKPITKRPLSSQPHQLPTQPKLPPQPKELTHPQATAHSRAHIAVPSRRPQLTHRPPHIRAMDMVHR